jgi:hypothetical protein
MHSTKAHLLKETSNELGAAILSGTLRTMGKIVEEPPLSFELPSSCDICHNQLKGPGAAERPAVLSCGRWMQGKRLDSENEAFATSDRGSCPICRRKLVY